MRFLGLAFLLAIVLMVVLALYISGREPALGKGMNIVDTIVEGDRVCFRLVGEGTHEGQLGPLPGSGKHVTVDVVDVCRFHDGRIAEHWGVADRMGIMEQVGMPQPPRWLMRLMMKRKR